MKTLGSFTTVTIRKILLSFYEENGNKNGFDTKFNAFGDYLSFNEVVNNSYKKFWQRINKNEFISERFQKDFLVYFYNSEIGFETVAPFFTRLQATLDTDCYMMLKLLDILRKMTIDDMLSTIDIFSNSESQGKSNQLGESKPQNDLQIVYDVDKSLIRYTDFIQEQINKAKSSSETHGRTTTSKYNALQDMTMYNDLQFQIFNVIEKRCFLQIYL